MTLRQVRVRMVTAALLLPVSLAFAQSDHGPKVDAAQERAAQQAAGHEEKIGDPYIPLSRDDALRSPGMRGQRDDFFFIQVNTDMFGNNIVGDAANEPSLAVDRDDPNRIAIGWRQFDTISSDFRQAGWGYSGDAGQTWTFPGVIEPGVFRSDPVLSADSSGVFYYNSLTKDASSNYWCNVYRSFDGGVTWDTGSYAHGGDKQWQEIDRSGGIGDGNIYAAWNLSFSSCSGQFTRSIDGGVTFQPCVLISGNPYWGTISFGPDGAMYVSGQGFLCVKSSTAQDPGANVTWDFSRSVDLGGSIEFSAGPNPGGLLGQCWIDVDRSGGPRDGWVYMLCSVDPSGSDPLDVHFARSTDGGSTWSSWQRVNDVQTGWQWFGTMSVAPNGRIDVVWLDSRDDPGGYDSALYYSSSSDGGDTWTPNQALTPSFDPHVGWPNQNKMGDYFDMVSDDFGAHLAFATTLNGEQDVYYGRIGDSPFPDAGRVSLDQPKYQCESTAEISVIDRGLDLDPNAPDIVAITVDSTTEPGGETVVLTETGDSTMRFLGTVTLSETDAVGVVQVTEGDILAATYIDEDDGQGGVNVIVTALAVIDCTDPVISGVTTAVVNPRSATITFQTDEPCVGTVSFGTSCGQLTEMTSGGVTTDHSITISGLMTNTPYFYAVDAADEAGNFSVDDNNGNCYAFATPDIPDFYTELFTSGFDLDGLKLTFIPDGSNDFYDACAEEITALPTDPAGGTTITLSDDDNELVSVTGGNEVYIYGAAYSGFYVGSNGYVTFGSGDTDYSETLEDHFDLPRISALFDDLSPNNGGTVSYKQLDDRIVVTWEEVPEYSNTGANTFQIEMFFDGMLTISYLGISASDGLAGLSEGVGLDPDYFPSDLSGLGACGPRPPTASAVEANTAISEPVAILLDASDDGLPDPPAALTYIIDSLPSSGTLTDPNGGEITGVPYTLLAGGNAVNYAPVPGTTAPDTFMYKANDGGVAPDGGDSNLAPVTITFGGPAWDPVAYDVTTGTAINSPIAVTLQADDPNGDPLTWHIASLPADGYLRTLDGTPIDSVPYTLPATEDAVRYLPPVGYNGVAMFDFYVTDFSATSNTATVTITVGGPSQILLVDLNEDPGWPMNGEWAFGVPQGLGGSAHGNPDPTGGYTGSNVLGVNLAGDYATTVGGPYFVTMGPIDLTDATEVELRFRRWLNSDYQPYASATVEVSTDGSNWTLLWENGGSPAVADSSWQAIALPATAADDAATVWFRWGYAVLQGGAFAYSGWNLDDIELWGLVPSAGILGDLNCDGVLSAADIDPFVLALTGGEAAYQAAYPDCYYLLADMNGDGAVSAADIDGFVQALTGGK
jgi:hypothetical protein